MSERKYMTLVKFKTLKNRDWENGAVRDELYQSVKRMEALEAKFKRWQIAGDAIAAESVIRKQSEIIQRVRDEVNQIDEAFKCRDSCSREAFRNIRSIVIALSKALENSE